MLYKHVLLLAMLKTVVLLNIFAESVIESAVMELAFIWINAHYL